MLCDEILEMDCSGLSNVLGNILVLNEGKNIGRMKRLVSLRKLQIRFSCRGEEVGK